MKPLIVNVWILCRLGQTRHSDVFQANLKRFMEHVHQKNVEKVSKWLEKGLDPNFHDSDSGGERRHRVYAQTRPSPPSRLC